MECTPVVCVHRSACMFAYKKHLLNAFLVIWRHGLTAAIRYLNNGHKYYAERHCGIHYTCPQPSRKPVLSNFVVSLSSLVSISVMAEWSWVAYTALEVLIAVACCLGNMLVVCAVCVGIRDSLREPTFCFLVSLAVADLLVGVAAVPLAVLLDGWVNLTPDLCLLLSCVVLVLTQASVLSLLAIAVDRYLRLHTPLRWDTHSETLVYRYKSYIQHILTCFVHFIPSFYLNTHSQIQSSGHTEANMFGCVCVLDTFLSAGVHPSVRLAQLLHSSIWFHKYIFLFLYLSTLHLPLCYLPSFHGLLQLPGMCHGAPAGHDPPLRSNLLEAAGPSKRQQSSSSGLSAQGEEAGLLPGSGPHFVCWLLDSSAPDELSAAVSWSSSCHTGDTIYRQVAVAFLVLTVCSWLFLCLKIYLYSSSIVLIISLLWLSLCNFSFQWIQVWQ